MSKNKADKPVENAAPEGMVENAAPEGMVENAVPEGMVEMTAVSTDTPTIGIGGDTFNVVDGVVIVPVEHIATCIAHGFALGRPNPKQAAPTDEQK